VLAQKGFCILEVVTSFFEQNTSNHKTEIIKKEFDTHMKKTIQKAGILFLIFLAAVVVYFISAQNTMEKEATIYSSMEEASLPVIYTVFNGKKVNPMHGYIQDMGNQAAGECISVLPENRSLHLSIAEYGNTITGISYEVRNLSLDRLLERTEVTGWESKDGNTEVDLPIQNLLTRNEAYLLSLVIDIGEKNVHYYTRIMWSDNSYASDMTALAEEFTRKSLDKEDARELVAYLETSPTEDNSSLGYSTIRASFRHLTWEGLTAELEGEPEITLQEFDGIMGHIQVKYQVALTQEDGSRFLVNAEDNFSMKWNERRIYLMNYERYANEIFDGSARSYSGKRILLGISDEKSIRAKKSPKSRYLAFQTNGDLWCYDQSSKEATRIFSFLSNVDDGVRSGYDRHGIKILSVQDNGDVDFLVYGYMNRGKNEGQTGVVFYHFDEEKDTVQEKFFIPSRETLEKIEANIDRLSYLSPNDMMYLMLDGNVYGIDLKSNESLMVAQGLTEGGFAVSADGSRFAWQDAGDIYQSQKLHVMDFNTSSNQEIVGAQGDYVRVLGFVGNDLIYGFGNSEDTWIVNGRVKGLPMYAMYIVDNEMVVQSEYKKKNVYISDVRAEDGRIHLRRLSKVDANQYAYQEEDTIVCNQKIDIDPMEGIGWFASQDKGKVYFVQVDSEIKAENVKTSSPHAFSYEDASTLELGNIGTENTGSGELFYAYGGGHYLGASGNFQEAVAMAYGKMGYVTDKNYHVVWDRINRRNAKTIKSPEEAARKITKNLDSFTGNKLYEDGIFMIDASGCSVSQVLYFIDKGIPVIAYTGSDQYVLLTGYDAYNITIYDPRTQESWKMGMGDGTHYFNSLQNDFLCGVEIE
jgi:hypothetical protein